MFPYQKPHRINDYTFLFVYYTLLIHCTNPFDLLGTIEMLTLERVKYTTCDLLYTWNFSQSCCHIKLINTF